MPTGPALLAQAQALVQAQALALAQASEATTVAEAQRDKAVQGGRMLAASLAAATDKNAALQSKNDALHTKVAALQALLEQGRASGAASKRETAAALAAGREQVAAITALEAERESERTVHAKLQAEQRRTGHTRQPEAGPATCRPAPSHSHTRLLGAATRARATQNPWPRAPKPAPYPNPNSHAHPNPNPPRLQAELAKARRQADKLDRELSRTALTRTPLGPPYCDVHPPSACCTYQRRRAAAPGRHALYIRGTRTGLGRAVRTACRGTLGRHTAATNLVRVRFRVRVGVGVSLALGLALTLGLALALTLTQNPNAGGATPSSS